MASALAKQVAAANQRARSMGMAGTLTTLDWRRTLEAFGGRCAYCGSSPAVTIDHFLPLATWGGATTQSNCAPSCLSCNRLKADINPDSQALSFVTPERLAFVRTYLQEVGRWHQESLRRTWEHVPKLARDPLAVGSLKRYCEQRAQASDDPHAASYVLLCRRIFGVAWDPAHAFQVKKGLHWNIAHATDTLDEEACKDALRFLDAELAQDGASHPER